MTYIDLSQPIYDNMLVYPGDPEVHITPVFTVEEHDWAVSRIEMVTHDGTHVNVPRHIDPDGKTLSQYPIDAFIAESVVYTGSDSIQPHQGVIFADQPIDMAMAQELASKKVALVGLSENFDFNLEAERYLLEQGIISYEKLANTDQLPKDTSFMFYGIPLLIKDGDGAPVRAFAHLVNLLN